MVLIRVLILLLGRQITNKQRLTTLVNTPKFYELGQSSKEDDVRDYYLMDFLRHAFKVGTF